MKTIFRLSLFVTVLISSVIFSGCKKEGNGKNKGEVVYLKYKEKLDDGTIGRVVGNENAHSIGLEQTFKNGYKAETVKFFLQTSTSALTPGIYTLGGSAAGSGSISTICYDWDLGASALLMDFSSGTIEIKSIVGNYYDIEIKATTSYGNTVKVWYKGELREN